MIGCTYAPPLPIGITCVKAYFICPIKIFFVAEEPSGLLPKRPVLVFIHGESFSWSSGNPYDGSVLASYGDILVVTVNFRLGVLGK